MQATVQTSETAARTRGVFHRNRRKLLRRFVQALMWLLPIMAFTTPVSQYTSSWQLLDIVKLSILGFACFGGAFAIKLHLDHHSFHRVIDPLIPLFAYLLLAIISVSWSALRSITIANAGALAAMLLFACAVGMLSTDRNSVETLLRRLNYVLLSVSGFVLIIYLVDPQASGLDRQLISHGGDGVIHPTASGGTASLGLLMPFLCSRIGRFAWAHRLILPALLIHGIILILSNSRLASGMALLTIGGVIWWTIDIRKRALLVFVLGLIAAFVVTADPGFRALSSTAGAGAEYVSRGQTVDEIRGVSGRSEMWSAIWVEYQKAMMFGHGYGVTSETGQMLVWNRLRNFTAHNMLLQVLSTTGAVGLVIFSYGLLQAWLSSLLLARGDVFQRRLFRILVVTGIWYTGWSMLGISFLGPIRPESVVFFTMLGICVGQASTNPARDE